MNFGHFFEACMLVCFGFSWPLNVIKAYKARTAKGTSLAFILLIITGYIAGISAKFVNHQFNYVLAVYFLNLAIVMTNVFVYIRNKGLDKKRAAEKMQVITATQNAINNAQADGAKEDNMNYTYSLDNLINPKGRSAREEKNAVILLGTGSDQKIPVQSLGKEFNFNFAIYNKSKDDLLVSNAKDYFAEKISGLKPEGVLIHLGSKDVASYKADNEKFVSSYLSLINEIKTCNKKCRIALVSVDNQANDKTIAMMNKHIKAVAESEKCSFVNLDNVKLWNPAATKAAVEFAHSMGLNTRKPLSDVAEILYSYAYKAIEQEAPVANMVG